MAEKELDKKTIEWRERFINKRPANLRPILPWTKIYFVDGTAIRNLIDSDYVQGGNPERYSWIPKNEIWIDDSIPKEEAFDVLLHESVETLLMSKGQDYDTAHDHAKAIEDNLRHHMVPANELTPPKIRSAIYKRILGLSIRASY